MFAGGEIKTTCNPKMLFSTYAQAAMCKEEREKDLKEPFHIAVTVYRSAGCFVVKKGHHEGCQSEALYDSWVYPNENKAHECAQSLTLLTGQKHEARLAATRFWFFMNAFKVSKEKLAQGNADK